jgi:hypothetical protein
MQVHQARYVASIESSPIEHAAVAAGRIKQALIT